MAEQAKPAAPPSGGVEKAILKSPSGGIKASLFGGPKKPAGTPIEVAQLAGDISTASTRLRILEERYENLRKKILVIEQNMLQNNKKLMTEIRASDDQIKDFGQVIEQMKEELKLIVRELKLTAKSDDMAQLKKYIGVWEPLNFVSRNEVKKLIDDAVDEKLKESKLE